MIHLHSPTPSPIEFMVTRASHFVRLIVSISLLVFTSSYLLWTPPVKAETPVTSQSIQPYLDRAIKRVTEFSLDNGMKFIVMENHEAPVVSFVTYADVEIGRAHV